MTTKDYQTRSPLRIFLSYFKPHRRLFALDLSCAFLIACIDLAFPLVSRAAMYTWLPQRQFRVFFIVMAVVVAAYVLRDGEERVMKASLYPDVHPNKPGRYRYFYEITIRRKPVLMMAEFRLTDNEEEWRTAEKTSLPPYISDAGKGGSPQLITEEPMEEPVYKVVEVMPEFPGGMKALMDFIQKNIRYPEEVRKNGIQGRVAVSVVIDENGRVTDPVIMRSRYPALDEEALRIVELMPQWKPGMQQGKAVKVEFTFPVTFKLE